MIQGALQFVSEHRAALATAGMAVVHFVHLAWPRVVAIYPYCRDNGGVIGIVHEFLHGKALAGGQQPKPS
jgi:cytochrome c oxidase subunit IV